MIRQAVSNFHAYRRPRRANSSLRMPQAPAVNSAYTTPTNPGYQLPPPAVPVQAPTPQAPIGAGYTTPQNAPAPAPAPRPFDPRYDYTTSSAGRDLGLTNQEIDWQQTQLGQQYNDPSNPFNQAAMLKRAYAQRGRGTYNTLASQGQLYSGAAGRQLKEVAFGYQKDKDAQQRAYEQKMHELALRRAKATNQYADTTSFANFDSLDRALQQQLAARGY